MKSKVLGEVVKRPQSRCLGTCFRHDSFRWQTVTSAAMAKMRCLVFVCWVESDGRLHSNSMTLFLIWSMIDFWRAPDFDFYTKNVCSELSTCVLCIYSVEEMWSVFFLSIDRLKLVLVLSRSNCAAMYLITVSSQFLSSFESLVLSLCFFGKYIATMAKLNNKRIFKSFTSRCVSCVGTRGSTFRLICEIDLITASLDGPPRKAAYTSHWTRLLVMPEKH